jgi:hypothetical protein
MPFLFGLVKGYPLDVTERITFKLPEWEIGVNDMELVFRDGKTMVQVTGKEIARRKVYQNQGRVFRKRQWYDKPIAKAHRYDYK